MLTVRRNLIGNIYERAAGGRRKGRKKERGMREEGRQSVRGRKKGKWWDAEVQDVKSQTRKGKESGFPQ